MKGVIVNYRQGRQTQNTYQMIVKFVGVVTKEQAQELVGKKVVWKTPGGHEIAGKVAGPHGNKGVVRVRFEKGMPGQALGTEVSTK